jgi:hypothetical protein
MTATLRDWYLATLGVVRYLPRQDDGDISEDALAAKPGADTATETPDTLKTIAPSSSLPVFEAEKPKSHKQEPQPGQVGVEEETVLQFRLGFWQPSPRMVVISTMPPGARPGADQQAMLANLLTAIGQLPAPLPSAELIDWPLARGGDTSLQGAREFLSVFLDAKTKLQPFDTALLMGELSARILANQQIPVAGRIALDCGANGIVCHSLHDMAANPGLKRETWNAIRHLAVN